MHEHYIVTFLHAAPPYIPMVNTKTVPFADGDLKHLDLKEVDKTKRWIELFNVDEDCSLKEFVETKGLVYKKGHVFYEFTNSVESISKDKEMIFMTKVRFHFVITNQNYIVTFCMYNPTEDQKT